MEPSVVSLCREDSPPQWWADNETISNYKEINYTAAWYFKIVDLDWCHIRYMDESCWLKELYWFW